MVCRRLLHGHRSRRDRNRPRIRGGGRRRRSRDRGSMQANQLDAFQETNYGVFTGFKTGRSAMATVWEIEAGYDADRIRVGRDELGRRSRFRLRRRGHQSTPTACSPSSTRPTRRSSISSPRVPHNAEDLRDPEFLDGQEVTNADDSELKLRSFRRIPSWRRLKAQVRPRGLIDKQRDFSFRAFENEDGVLEEDDDRACRSSTPRTSAQTATSNGRWTSATA